MNTSLIVNADECITKYNDIKESLQLPLKLKLYFTFLQSALQESSSHKNTHNFQGFSPLFYAIFCQLSKQEKAYYLYSNIFSIRKQSEKFETNIDEKPNKSETGNNVTASGQMSESVMGLSYWSKVKVIFSYETKQIKLETKNRIFTIDVRLYLIRKSKKYKSTLVLEAISEIVSQSDRKISLFFKSTIFDEIYNQILKCIINYRNLQLYKIALDQSINTNSSNFTEVSYIGANSKSLNFLGSKNINQFLNFKDNVLKKLLRTDYHFDNVYTDQNCKIGVDKSKSRFNQLYKLQTNFNCSVQTLKKTFLQKYKNKSFKYLMQSQQLQKFSNKYSAIYQKLLFKPSIFSFRAIQQIIIQEINEKEITCENQELIFKKGVHGVKNNPLLQFLMIKVKGLGTKNKSKLIVVGSFNNVDDTEKSKQKQKTQSIEVQDNQQIIIMYLLQFSQMIFRKEAQPQNIKKLLQQLRSHDESVEQNYENQFITVQGNFGGNDQQGQLVLDADEIKQSNQNQIGSFPTVKPSLRFKKGLSLEEKLTSFIQTPLTFVQNKRRQSICSVSGLAGKQTNYLNHSYQLRPTPIVPGSNCKKEIQKKHFLFEEWNRKPKGGLVCKDLNAINEQKKVANYIITTLGKRLLEQKGGLLNLSLPVTIFKPESHLHSVARNLSFAPTLLERACDMTPIQRMKMVVLYAMSVTVSSISVNKPFNPILGQTLQVWIDGCPVYLQQISHHPPVVSYYMIGRGYKLYGSIGPKTSLGFNSIVGYAEQPNFVQFNDGTVIQMNFGKMLINGIIIGQRTFNFTDKMYVIDPKNKLFCDLRLGKEKGSFFSMSNLPQDSLNGKIVSVTNEFINQFYNSSKLTYPNKSQIQQQLSILQGSWNGRIQFDSKQYINFSSANGCVVQNEKFPLPSDSSFRKDIQCLKEGCINSSQSQKQKLQVLQRRDQKLRVQAMKKQ